MNLTARIEYEPFLRALANRVRASEENARCGLEVICRMVVAYVKENGPWTDRTGNLRDSIDYVIDPTPGVIRGTVFAGMDYAIHVENKEGYWVLSGAADWIRPIVHRIFKGFFRVGGVIPPG